MGPSKAGKIQCVVMDFHAENEYTVFKIFSKSPDHKNMTFLNPITPGVSDQRLLPGGGL